VFVSSNNQDFNGANTEVLNSVFNSMKNQPELAKARFFVKSEWNDGFSVTSSIKDFRIGDNPMLRNKEYKIAYDFPEQLSGEGQGPTVCENCMGSLAACLTQTIVAHATSRGIKLDSINVGVEGDIDLRGFFGLSSNIRPGAQQFRVTIKIESDTASKEQVNELYEIGKKFSPAFDTLSNGTSVILLAS
jgi:uncharacterized OsmC-like protein